jgi:hypothetical protein
MKRKNTGLILIITYLILVGILFYLYPILPAINPFYKSEISRYENGDISSKEYWKYSLFPIVDAEVPDGWSIKSKIYAETVFTATDPVETEKLTGDVSIEIYKGEDLVTSLMAVTGVGGMGGVYYNFPDSDPDKLEDMIEASKKEDSYIEVVNVGVGEYSEVNLFGLEVRRVGLSYVPNIYEGEKEYFSNALEPVLFHFGDESGPQYKLYYNGELQEDCGDKYILRVLADNPTEDDMETVDSILDSMEMR